MSDRASYATTAGTWAAAFVLLGLPTASVVVTLGAVVTLPLGLDPPWYVDLIVWGAAILVGAKAADEATRVRLHGWREIHRGSSARVLAGHVLLAVPALLGLGFLCLTLVGVAAAFRDLHEPAAVALFLVVAAVLLFVTVRTVRAFREGRREATDGDDGGCSLARAPVPSQSSGATPRLSGRRHRSPVRLRSFRS